VSCGTIENVRTYFFCVVVAERFEFRFLDQIGPRDEQESEQKIVIRAHVDGLNALKLEVLAVMLLEVDPGPWSGRGLLDFPPDFDELRDPFAR
jgi:hypothetical protein